jgi:hypothetical protein
VVKEKLNDYKTDGVSLMYNLIIAINKTLVNDLLFLSYNRHFKDILKKLKVILVVSEQDRVNKVQVKSLLCEMHGWPLEEQINLIGI